MSALARKLARELWARKGPLLTLVAIGIVGVACIVGMLGVYYDLDDSRARFYRRQRLADFSVSMKRAPEGVTRELEALPNVRHVEGRVRVAARLLLPGLDEPVTGTALSLPRERQPVLNDVLLVSGTWFSGRRDDETLVNDAFARARGLRPGSFVDALIVGRQARLLVVGTVMSPEFVYVLPPAGGFVPDPARSGVLFLPKRVLQEWADMDGAVNELVGLAVDPRDRPLRNTLKLVEERLDRYGVTTAVPASELPSVQFLANELDELEVSATILPAICLGVVALVLNIVMGRIVAQQRTVIGTLRALGYTTAFIMRHYMAYGLAVGLLAAGGGIALGLWMQSAMCALYRQYFELPSIEPGFHPGLLGFAVGLSLAFALGGTLGAVRRAAALDPAEAMRPPPPEKGGRILLERLPFLWSPLPFRWKIVLRSVFRNPFRSLVQVATTCVATALIVESLSMVAAVRFMIDYEFKHTSRQDVTLSLREPVGRAVVEEMRGLPGVMLTEPQLGLSADLSRGPWEKRTGVTGLVPGNVLFTPLDSRGQPIQPPSEGLLLSRKLAEMLHVEPGQSVRLRPLVGTRRVAEAPVAGVVDTYVGLGAYARLDYLSRLIGEEWVANSLLVDLDQPVPSRAFLEAVEERPAVVGVEQRVRALERLDQVLQQSLGTSLTILILFSGLLAFGSVLNTALVTLSERRREVGTLRVLGYTSMQVGRIFLAEAALLNGVGILTGLYAGIGLVHLIVKAYSRELFRLPAVIPPEALILAVLVMGVFIALAQLVLFRLVRSLPWLEVFKVRE